MCIRDRYVCLCAGRDIVCLWLCLRGETYYVCDDYVCGDIVCLCSGTDIVCMCAGRDIVCLWGYACGEDIVCLCMSVCGDRHSMYVCVCGERHRMSMMAMYAGRDIVYLCMCYGESHSTYAQTDYRTKLHSGCRPKRHNTSSSLLLLLFWKKLHICINRSICDVAEGGLLCPS